jgi:hypothetical protein
VKQVVGSSVDISNEDDVDFADDVQPKYSDEVYDTLTDFWLDKKL